MRFNKLPNEIQYDIFANFSAEELCTRVAPVCRHWRQFAYDPTLWKDVKFRGSELSSLQISQIMKRSFRIRQLTLGNVVNFSWLKDLPRCESLRQIGFASSCDIPEETMSQFIQKYPHVQSCLYYSQPEAFDPLIKQIVRWQYLTTISLPRASTSCLPFIAKNCVNLTNFNMELDNETDESLHTFLKLRGPQMRDLSLKFLDHLSSNAYLSLLQCPRLHNLILYAAKNFSDLNFARLSELKELKIVTISRSELLFTTESFTLYQTVRFPPMESMVFTPSDNCIFNVETLESFLECSSFKHLTFNLSSVVTKRQCLSVARECDKYRFGRHTKRRVVHLTYRNDVMSTKSRSI